MKISGNITIGKIVNQPGSSFNGELQEKYNVIIPGFVARDENGSLYLFLGTGNIDKRQFVRKKGGWGVGYWFLMDDRGYVQIDNGLFPDVKWEDDYPTEVKIRIF